MHSSRFYTVDSLPVCQSNEGPLTIFIKGRHNTILECSITTTMRVYFQRMKTIKVT